MALRTFLGDAGLEELVVNLVRVGEVTSVDVGRHRARVRFEDQENVESFDLLIVERTTGRRKSRAPYAVGDRVLCLFLPIGVETGFIIGSYYGARTPPSGSADVDVVEYEDGARFEYDLDAGALKVSGVASVEVESADALAIVVGGSKIEIDGSQIVIESNGSKLELSASGAALSGARVDLN